MHVSNHIFFSRTHWLDEILYVCGGFGPEHWQKLYSQNGSARNSVFSCRNGVDCVQVCAMSLHSDVVLHLQRFVHFSFSGCLHRLSCQLEAEKALCNCRERQKDPSKLEGEWMYLALEDSWHLLSPALLWFSVHFAQGPYDCSDFIFIQNITIFVSWVKLNRVSPASTVNSHHRYPSV